MTALLICAALVAVLDGVRIHAQGNSAASWTATYIIVAGTVLLVLALASLLPSSRRSAASDLSASVAEDILADASEEEKKQVKEEPVDAAAARSLLLRSIGLLILWTLATPLIGYIATTALFLVAYGLLVSKKRILPTLIFAIVTTSVAAVLFQTVGIQLPTGSLF